MNTKKPLIKNFWSHISIKDGSGCWEWKGAKASSGYGKFHMRGVQTPAHRAAWGFYRGEIPKGLYVLHRCDNPPCVNPAHLFLGTAKDNAVDRDTKGRANPPIGERCSKHKIKTNDVLKIRELRKTTTLSQTAIGNMFGVTQGEISRIVNHKQWRHL